MDEYARELSKQIKKICLKMTVKCVYLFTDLTLTGSEFQRVATEAEKALVLMFVSTLGTKLDEN